MCSILDIYSIGAWLPPAAGKRHCLKIEMKLLFQHSGPKTVQKVYRNDINKFLEKILAAISQCSDPEFCLGCNDDESTQYVIDTLKLNILSSRL